MPSPFLDTWQLAVLEDMKRKHSEVHQQQTEEDAIPRPLMLIGGRNPQRIDTVATDFSFFTKDELVREFHRLSIKLDGLRTSARYVEGGAEAFKQVAEERQGVADALSAIGVDVSLLL